MKVVGGVGTLKHMIYSSEQLFANKGVSKTQCLCSFTEKHSFSAMVQSSYMCMEQKRRMIVTSTG